MKTTLVIILTCLGASPAFAQSVVSTTSVAPLVGRNATSQLGISLYGTDLGYSASYGGALRILFGDSWADSNATPIGSGADDCTGSISLTTFPDGDSVDQFAKVGNVVVPWWQAKGPTVAMQKNAFAKVAPLQLYDGAHDLFEPWLDMGLGKTPTAMFANKSAGGGVFAQFGRQVLVFATAATACPTGFTNDTGMGTCNGTSTEGSIPCVLTTTRCLCARPAGITGVCLDRTSSVYLNTEDGRILSTVMRNRIGVADQSSPALADLFYTKEFLTNKFINPATRTVMDFLPTRANGVGNNYAAGSGSGANEKVFMWGRPNFVAFGNWQNTSAKLYFAYVTKPKYTNLGNFAWAPQYYMGLSTAGVPLFSTDPSKATALDLSGGSDPTKEAMDITGQMSVSWVPSLGRFVMLYGGDIAPSALNVIVGPNYGNIVHNPDGAIFARFASQPWGPWSAPQPVLKQGSEPLATREYGQNGILYGTSCTTGCAGTEPAYADWAKENKIGRVYGASIVENWTETRTANNADIYWFASTWNPYQVIVMRTRIKP